MSERLIAHVQRELAAIETAGTWTSAYWASLTVGRLVLGGVIDRVGPDRMVRAATVGAVAGVALFASVEGVVGCLGLLLLGSSLAPVFPTLMARTPARVGDGLAHHAVGLQVSASTLGAALGPSAVALLVARQGLGVVGGAVIAIAFSVVIVIIMVFILIMVTVFMMWRMLFFSFMLMFVVTLRPSV